jgi:hypothetical protein
MILTTWVLRSAAVPSFVVHRAFTVDPPRCMPSECVRFERLPLAAIASAGGISP